MTIPFIDLQTQYRALQSEIGAALTRVLEHGQYIMGPEVSEMEEALAAFAGTAHCVAVASGTEALLISLMALGIGPGDEVIIPAFTFAATAEVVVLVGATPVLVDVEPDTCNINTAAIEQAVTERTRAIIPVSLYGQPADMTEIGGIAARHGLTVIEDAAQSFGAAYGNRRSCALSAIGCTSFFPSKPLGCYGDGGAIFTDDAGLAEAFRAIRIHGQSVRYHHTRIGVGGRMDTMQCAIVLAKLGRFEWEIARRTEIGERYNRLFDERNVRHVVQRSDRTSVFAQYTVMVSERPKVIAALTAAGIPAAVHYPVPLSAQPAYAEICSGGPVPVSEWLSETVLSLPMHPDLDEATQDQIVEAVALAVSLRP
ncbi:MAG TPA: DegT/DnrJ/EryC1/StrS family aminotransferase [Sphingomicrobium sp.]|nr:DegT/DnrJ/EryC1/StrS family aminotransferase [Sphingomicrobium sp.]